MPGVVGNMEFRTRPRNARSSQNSLYRTEQQYAVHLHKRLSSDAGKAGTLVHSSAALDSPIHFSMVRERVKATCIPRLRCFPAQVKHTKEPCATEAQSAQGPSQSAQRLQKET